MSDKSVGETPPEARYEVEHSESQPTTSPLNLVTLSAQRDSSPSPRSPQDGQTKLPAVTFEEVLGMYGTARNEGPQDTQVYPQTSPHPEQSNQEYGRQPDGQPLRQSGSLAPSFSGNPRVESPTQTKPQARVEPSSERESWPKTVLAQPERQSLLKEHDTFPPNCKNHSALKTLNIAAGIISFSAAVLAQSPQARALWFVLGAANLGSSEVQRRKEKSLCAKDSK